MKSHASMNRIYRLVFNAALGIWVAVAENARGRGKGGRAASALLSVLAILTAISPSAYAANAANATVVGGAGTVATTGLATTINQTSQRLAIDWTQLSTAANEALRFNQPNAQAIALNRIIGSSPSLFLGSLTANGQVFILNPNGILFGAGSQVNVGGIVASTLSMSNTSFMAGSNTFTNSGGTGSVVNQGTMTTAQGGYLALLAPEVRNEGVMTASLGTALLAAGNKVTLNLDNGSLLGYSIDEKAIGALVDNKQLIKTDGGQVILSARAVDSLSSGVVNNTGIVEAKTLNNVGGKILLEGDLVIQSGTLNASGTTGGNITLNARAIIDAGTANVNGTNQSNGNGGNITYNATQAIVQTASAKLSADGATSGGQISLNGGNNLFTSGTLSATGQNGGTVDLLGNRVVLSAASVDASGTADGGLIRVGGDFKGTNPNIRNAQTTLVNGASTLKADGNNGKVVVWSDDKTDFYGSIIATGNGQAEVSSKGTLTYGGNAALGAGGSLLLDPANIIIDNTAGPAAFALLDPNAFAGKWFGGNLTVLGSTTGGTFTQNGKVVVAASTDNLGGTNAGAVYLFDTTTGALVSTLTGTTNDGVGNNGITALTNGNYVVGSSSWNGNMGTATWGSGTAGAVGVVSAANSLVGSTAGDYVGRNGITALTNGNYVVRSGNWNGNMGAATWGSGTAGVLGVVSAANSLVGSTANDQVGGDSITALTNGSYVVGSGSWNGARGAATWGSGTAGAVGAVSAANSLVGSTADDQVGGNDITALTNGNYVVGSPNFATGAGQLLVGTPGNIGFDIASGQTMRFNPLGISATLAGGTAVTLQASNDITVNSNIMVAGSAGGALTLQAGRNINLNSVITTANGNFTASAGDAAATGSGRVAGAASINFGTGSAINVGTGVKTLLVNGVDINLPVVSSTSSTVANPFTTTASEQFKAALQSVLQVSNQTSGGTGGGGASAKTIYFPEDLQKALNLGILSLDVAPN